MKFLLLRVKIDAVKMGIGHEPVAHVVCSPKAIMHATNVLEPIHCSLKVDWFASCNISLCICENVFTSYDNVVMGFCWIKAYGICVNG